MAKGLKERWSNRECSKLSTLMSSPHPVMSSLCHSPAHAPFESRPLLSLLAAPRDLPWLARSSCRRALPSRRECLHPGTSTSTIRAPSRNSKLSSQPSLRWGGSGWEEWEELDRLGEVGGVGRSEVLGGVRGMGGVRRSGRSWTG